MSFITSIFCEIMILKNPARAIRHDHGAMKQLFVETVIRDGNFPQNFQGTSLE
jgi:hypothetical protein